MQDELDAAGASVSLLGVNGSGYESGNALAVAARDIPWLQDEFAVDAWSLWGVTYRDVWILDGQNELLAVYNLTEHDLRVQANYDELKAMLLEAAAR